MSSLWIAPIACILWIVLLLGLKKLVFRTLRAKKKELDLLLEAASTPLNLFIVASGIVIVDQTLSAFDGSHVPSSLLIAYKASVIISIILFIDRLVRSLLNIYSDRITVLKTSSGVAQVAARILVFALGLLILLDTFGISITPIIASLGIGSLAVALALQPTLENFFAGIQIIVDKPFMIGHFIKLDSGEEGYIHKIGWRSVWVRLLANNMVVIPNKVMINTKFLNTYYPTPEMSTLVHIGVHFNSDLEHVERVTLEVARETLQEVSGGTKTFKPFMRYHTFGEYSIQYTVILRVDEFVDNYFVKHEFVKRLHRRFAQEGIVIPYPIRATNYSQERRPEELE